MRTSRPLEPGCGLLCEWKSPKRRGRRLSSRAACVMRAPTIDLFLGEALSFLCFFSSGGPQPPIRALANTPLHALSAAVRALPSTVLDFFPYHFIEALAGGGKSGTLLCPPIVGPETRGAASIPRKSSQLAFPFPETCSRRVSFFPHCRVPCVLTSRFLTRPSFDQFTNPFSWPRYRVNTTTLSRTDRSMI